MIEVFAVIELEKTFIDIVGSKIETSKTLNNNTILFSKKQHKLTLKHISYHTQLFNWEE